MGHEGTHGTGQPRLPHKPPVLPKAEQMALIDSLEASLTRQEEKKILVDEKNNDKKKIHRDTDCDQLNRPVAPWRCSRCGEGAAWRSRGGDEWFCRRCRPPPSEACVGEELSGLNAMSKSCVISEHSPVVVCYEGPVCSRCCGSWVIETFGEAGSMKCFSCRTEVFPEEIFERRIPERKSNNRDRRKKYRSIDFTKRD